MGEPSQIIRVSDASVSKACEGNPGTPPQPAALEPPRAPALPLPDAPARQPEIVVPGYANSVLRRPIVRPLSPLEGARASVLSSAPAAVPQTGPATLACGALGGRGGDGRGGASGLVSGHSAPPPAKRPRFLSASPGRAVGEGMGSEQESVEERRRRRVLNNRESAMRSLQKKEDFAAKLEQEEREQRRVLSARCKALVETVKTAKDARNQMASANGERFSLLAEVDDCIARCKQALAGEAAEEAAAGVCDSGPDPAFPAKPTAGAEEGGPSGDLSSVGGGNSADVTCAAANARVEIDAAVEAGGE